MRWRCIPLPCRANAGADSRTLIRTPPLGTSNHFSGQRRHALACAVRVVLRVPVGAGPRFAFCAVLFGLWNGFWFLGWLLFAECSALLLL